MNRLRLWMSFIGVMVWGMEALHAQGTYKLEVKPNLKPSAILSLEEGQVRRSALKDDPGFRMEFTFKKDGKTLKIIQARGTDRVDLPDKTPGVYSAVLELFYPSYKGGNEQKGKFQPASNELIYEVKAPAQAGGQVQVVLLASRPLPDTSRVLGKPALVVQCGKELGKKEKELVSPGYDCQLIQGTPYDGWKTPAGKSHCWMDKEKVHFVVQMPKGTAGVLRLHMVDGDGNNMLFRFQKLLVAGKQISQQAVFHGAGIIEFVDLAADDTKDGRVEVMVQTLLPKLTAVISTVEFFPAEKK